MSTRAKGLDADALRWAHLKSPMPASLVTQAVEAYVEGLKRQRLDKNPALRALAYMRVGDHIPWDKNDKRPCLQSIYKTRARMLMRDPDADWRYHNSPSLGGTVWRVR